MATVTLLQAWPFNAATGETVETRLAGGGSRGYRQLGHTDWRSGIATVPRFGSSLGFDQDGWGNGVVPQTTQIRFFPSDTSLLSELGGRVWKGARIIYSVGDDEDPGETYPVDLKGTVADHKVTGGALVLTVSDLSVELNKPVVPSLFAGTGGVEGGADATGRVKRRSWGVVEDIEGRVLDAAYNIYEFGDPARPLNAITALRDKGREGPTTSVAWAGSVAATFTALRAATPLPGGGVVAPSIACAKWWTVPSGPLTADLQGEVGTGYTNVAARIAARIALEFSPDMTVGNLTEAAGWQGGPAGIHADSATETTGSLLDRLLLPIRIAWVVDPDGTLMFRLISFDSPVDTIQAETIEREVVFAPILKRQLGYKKNHKQHTDGEISAALIDSANAYTLVNVANAAFPAPSVVTKTNADGWTTKAYIVEGGSTPFVSAISSSETYVGLTTDPTVDSDSASVDYALVKHSDGTLRVARNGTLGASLGSYTADDRLGIYSDAASIHYLKNGIEIVAAKHASNSPGETLYPVFAIYRTTGSIQAITYSAAGLAGATGAAGAPAVAGYLTNESHTLPAAADGTVSSYAGATGSFKVFAGGGDISANFALSTATGGNPQALTVNYTGQTYTVSGGFDAGEDSATLTILANGSGTWAGVTLSKTFSLGKSKTGTAGTNGSNGTNAKLLDVTTNRQLITYDGTGALAPSSQTTTFVAALQNSSATITWSMARIDGTPLTASSYLSGTTGSTVTMTAANFDAARGTTEGVVVTASATDVVSLHDSVTVARLKAGSNGLDGTDGIDGTDGLNAYVHFAYADSADGTVNFTTGAQGSRKYQGVYADNTLADSTNPAAYNWSLWVPDNGAPGTPGANGLTPYFHTAWSDAADGSVNFSTGDPTGRKYLGSYADYTPADSTNPAVYAWSLIKGADGTDGTDGADGNYRDLKFTVSDGQPATPTGDNPSGWTDGIPGSGKVWMIVGDKTFAGVLIGGWSPPRQITTGPRGAYSPTETYYLGDIVTYNGGSYAASANNFSGQAPSGTAQANSYWDVVAAPGDPGTPATPPSGFSATINISSTSGTVNLRTLADANGYTGASDATITFAVGSGVTVRGFGGTNGGGGGIGIDTGTWPTGYTIALTLTNAGTIDGGGGAGADGGGYGSAPPGGAAIYLRVNMTGGITNTGTIRGGGGGGGPEAWSGTSFKIGPDGAGGGAPNGAGGIGQEGSQSIGFDGHAGTTSGGGAKGGSGAGDGGTFGTAGSGGTGGSGGAGGYAVQKNGYTATVSGGTIIGTVG